MQKGISRETSLTEENSHEFRADFTHTVSSGVELKAFSAGAESTCSFGATYSSSSSVTTSDISTTMQETQTHLSVPPWSQVDLSQLIIVDSPYGAAMAQTTLFTSHYSVQITPLLPQPDHCGNGQKDGDEEGIDCGGSCMADCACCSSSSSSPNLVINSDNVTIADTCDADDAGALSVGSANTDVECVGMHLRAKLLPNIDPNSVSMVIDVTGYAGSIDDLTVRIVHFDDSANGFMMTPISVTESQLFNIGGTTTATAVLSDLSLGMPLTSVASMFVDFNVPDNVFGSLHACAVHGAVNLEAIEVITQIDELGRRLETAEDDLEANTLCDWQRRCCWGHFCSTSGGVYGDSSVWGPAAGRYDVTPGKLQNLINCYEWCGHLSCQALNATIAGDPDRWICKG